MKKLDFDTMEWWIIGGIIISAIIGIFNNISFISSVIFIILLYVYIKHKRDKIMVNVKRPKEKEKKSEE